MTDQSNQNDEFHDRRNFGRKYDSFPNLTSTERVARLGEDFFAPSASDMSAVDPALKKIIGSGEHAVLLPVGSEREFATFAQVLRYVKSFIQPEYIAIICPSRVSETLREHVRKEGCSQSVMLVEESIASCLDQSKIDIAFGVDLKKYRGKGKAFSLAFLYINEVLKNGAWKNLKYLHFYDTDVNAAHFKPLEYVAYPLLSLKGTSEPVGIWTAQSNSLRNNWPMSVAMDTLQFLGEPGKTYGRHLSKLVWRLTGEFCINWNCFAEKLFGSMAYCIEMAILLSSFDAADRTNAGIVQVANPNIKADGGHDGEPLTRMYTAEERSKLYRNRQCYEQLMYGQINRFAFAVAKQEKKLEDFTDADVKNCNKLLGSLDSIVIIPDGRDDNGPNIRVNMLPDLLFPSIELLKKGKYVDWNQLKKS